MVEGRPRQAGGRAAAPLALVADGPWEHRSVRHLCAPTYLPAYLSVLPVQLPAKLANTAIFSMSPVSLHEHASVGVIHKKALLMGGGLSAGWDVFGFVHLGRGLAGYSNKAFLGGRRTAHCLLPIGMHSGLSHGECAAQASRQTNGALPMVPMPQALYATTYLFGSTGPVPDRLCPDRHA